MEPGREPGSISIIINIHIIANPSGYLADLLATVRGRCLVFRPWCQRGCLKLRGICLEFALRGLLRIIDEPECQVTQSDIHLFNKSILGLRSCPGPWTQCSDL